TKRSLPSTPNQRRCRPSRKKPSRSTRLKTPPPGRHCRNSTASMLSCRCSSAAKQAQRFNRSATPKRKTTPKDKIREKRPRIEHRLNAERREYQFAFSNPCSIGVQSVA